MAFSLLSYSLPGSKAEKILHNLAHATLMTSSTLSVSSNPTLSSPSTLHTTLSPALFMKRQGGGIVSLSIPFPASALTPSTNPNPNGVPIPLLISPYPLIPATSSRSSSSIAVSSTGSSATTTSSYIVPTTNNTQHLRITPSTLLPFILLASCSVLALMGWCLHGWCTRKPKEKFKVNMIKDGDGHKFKRGRRSLAKGYARGNEEEFIYGPKYDSLADVEGGFESEGYDDRVLGRDPYQWPSLSMSLPLHKVMTSNGQRRVGRYLPRRNEYEYESGEEEGRGDGGSGMNPSTTDVHASAPSSANVESTYRPIHSGSQSPQHLMGRRPSAPPRPSAPYLDKHERVRIHSRGTRRRPASANAITTSSASASASSSPTSVALKELYEGVLMALSVSEAAPDTEKDVKTPLIDVGGASSTGLGSAGKFEMKGTSESGRKRRTYKGRGSESDLGDEVDGNVAIGSKWDWDDRTGMKLEVRNPSVGAGRLGLCDNSDWQEEEQNGDENEYSPLPTPTKVVHEERERGNSLGSQLQHHQHPITRDILPAHPKQITSPPLDNQICFVPMDAVDTGVAKGHRAV